ncbi:NAD(P)/FAD-dependent oxidoreductase [Aneurinibacillus sp. REN35]|uniref:NAD(P)/FAD-dependent oxidoreductase n=1 Tax=Aneurinibacillus sp. REN35 TaxID=3237286 RepID=UPI00352740BF
MQIADAVVIGGGIIGTSIAFRLARQGRSVVLIEKGILASGTSGACDKAIFLQSKKVGLHLELAKASAALYQSLEEELDTSLEYERTGGMIVIETEEQLEIMKGFVEKQQHSGIRVDLLSQAETHAMQPTLSPHVVGATWSGEDADVNPLLVTHGFASAAKRAGAVIMTHTEVMGIMKEKNRVTGVMTSRGAIATELIINAAGPYAPTIGRLAGVEIPIIPRRGMILITERMPPMLKGNMLCAQYITAKHMAGAEPAKQQEDRCGIGLSFGQTKSGNFLLGGSREFTGFDRHVPPETLRKIASHACRIIPFLCNTRIIRTMVGFRPFTGDGLPIIGEAPELKGFIIAAGHEGDGIALSPITGMIVANIAEKRGPYLALAESLGLERFQDRPLTRSL